ncbi:MAG: response regulator, partial [Desulfobulbaceae bacterium]|nr:response regulator [Desulfobulbaceae bacterium]
DVGKVTIETGNVRFDETRYANHRSIKHGEYVLLGVSDNGCGMDAETREKIFEPFFTTKEYGQGTGLGLATVYGVVKQNNGFVNVYSEPDQGTIFKIYFPRHGTEANALPEKVKAHPVERGDETILLVEDETAILEMITTILDRLGYQVVAASTTGEAIRLAQEYAGKIHLLVSDVIMPEMNGRDLAQNILSIHPNIKCLFMSGYSANVIARNGVLDKGVNFIQKPFSMKELGAKVREVLDEAKL